MTAEEQRDGLLAAVENVQRILCTYGVLDQDRHNAVARVVHIAILDFGGGYSDSGDWEPPTTSSTPPEADKPEATSP